MNIPTSFTASLKREFDGRLRMRWSPFRREYHIEQKVEASQVDAPKGLDTDHVDQDDSTRARDGYVYVMSIRTGDRMPCPLCNRTIRVPVRVTGEAKCEDCDKTFRAAFFPLNDILLEHLRKMDPLRDGIARVVSEADNDNLMRQVRLDRQMSNVVEDGIKDNFNALFDIQHVGYTGRENAWIR